LITIFKALSSLLLVSASCVVLSQEKGKEPQRRWFTPADIVNTPQSREEKNIDSILCPSKDNVVVFDADRKATVCRPKTDVERYCQSPKTRELLEGCFKAIDDLTCKTELPREVYKKQAQAYTKYFTLVAFLKTKPEHLEQARKIEEGGPPSMPYRLATCYNYKKPIYIWKTE
jgi:hypothetical protein